jgi:NADH:ubiquinone oxidoreductase subunit K
MISLQSALVGFFSGVILTLSWVFFVDGQITSHDRFTGTHILPSIFATLAAVCVNLISVNDVTGERVIVKVWLFFWVTVQCICIGAAIFILSTEYPLTDNYPGIAIMIQTILCMIAAFLFFIGRKRGESN